MSRAPAPMKNETSPGTGATNNMPNNMMPSHPGGGTAAPMHAMQHMYTNMQQPQYSNGMQYPHTAQNAGNQMNR